MKRPSRRRDYCATVNNPPGIPDFTKATAKVHYCCYNEEIGKKGTHHFQIFLYFKVAISWNSARKNVKLIFGKSGDVDQVNSSIEDAIHYCSKPCADENCDKDGCKEVRSNKSKVLSKNEFGTRPQQGDRTDLGAKHFAAAINLAKKGQVEEAQELLIAKRPRDWILNAPKIKAALIDLAPKKEFEHRFTIEQFSGPELDLTKAAFIRGPTGCGKTNFALAHFKSPLLISDIDQLKDKDMEKYDGIVFDDCSFTHWPPESVIKLLDMEFPRAIRCRYTNATIPAGMPRIFTHNLTDIFCNYNCKEEQEKAIRRRYNLYIVTEDLRKKKTPGPTITIDEFNASGGLGEE